MQINLKTNTPKEKINPNKPSKQRKPRKTIRYSWKKDTKNHKERCKYERIIKRT